MKSRKTLTCSLQLSCLLETFPAANCSLLNTTCQCNSGPLVLSTSKCLLKNCTLADSLGMQQTKGAHPALISNFPADQHLVLGKLRDKICKRPPQSRERPLLAVNVAMGTLSLLLVSLRVLSRYLVSKRIWIDDSIILATMVGAHRHWQTRGLTPLVVSQYSFYCNWRLE